MSSDLPLYAEPEAPPTDAELQARNRQQRDADDVRWLMANEQGRRFARRLLEEAKLFRSTYAGDLNNMLVAEGARGIGLFVLREVGTHSPEHLASLMTADA